MGPGGEHGVHALVRGPNGHVWTVVGNHIDVPEQILTRDRYRDWQEDLILPRMWDPNGHAVGHLAPAGQVLRIDPDTLEWERVAGGFRNSYDLAFHHDGSLFTYDADMELGHRNSVVSIAPSGGGGSLEATRVGVAEMRSGPTGSPMR